MQFREDSSKTYKFSTFAKLHNNKILKWWYYGEKDDLSCIRF